jgi:Transcriptional regulator
VVGVKLIDRTRRSFDLTEEGKQFYTNACALLEQHNRLMSSLQEEKRDMEGSVSVVIPASIMNLYFPKVLVDIAKLYPKINLNVFEAGSNAAVEHVLRKKADLGVVMLPVGTADLELYDLVRDRCMLIGHKSNPLLQKPVVALRELEHEDFLMFNNQFVLHDTLMYHFQVNGLNPSMRYQSSQDSFIMEMVHLNQGVAILPRPVVMGRQNRYPDVVSAELETVIPCNIALAVGKGVYLSRAAEAVKQAIYAYFNGPEAPEL